MQEIGVACCTAMQRNGSEVFYLCAPLCPAAPLLRPRFLRGWVCERDLFRGGPLSARPVHFQASPPPVPCAPCDGAREDIVGDAHLPRARAQQWTEYSNLGAQSTWPLLAVQQSIVGSMGCASMHATPCKLPSQVLASTIRYWTVAVSHVQWARQFKLF